SASLPLIERDVHERHRIAQASSPALGLGERKFAARCRTTQRGEIALAVPNRPGFHLEIAAPSLRRRVRLARSPTRPKFGVTNRRYHPTVLGLGWNRRVRFLATTEANARLPPATASLH